MSICQMYNRAHNNSIILHAIDFGLSQDIVEFILWEELFNTTASGASFDKRNQLKQYLK